MLILRHRFDKTISSMGRMGLLAECLAIAIAISPLAHLAHKSHQSHHSHSAHLAFEAANFAMKEAEFPEFSILGGLFGGCFALNDL